MRLFDSFKAYDKIPFHKLSEDGKVLSENATWASGARVIYDENTGLIWEIKSPEPSDINYCKAQYNFEDALQVYIKKLNANHYAGHEDWRMPNKDELRSIMDYQRAECALDPNIFENCPIGDYWTKNVYKLQPYFGWVIFTGFGSGIAKSMESKRYVMAVCGGHDRRFGENDDTRFIDHHDGTVTDSATGLMWQKGENRRMAPEEAEIVCAKMNLAGYSDWRLPNIKELNTILNLDENSPNWFFEKVFTEGSKEGMLHYSSSTVFKNHYAWVTNFTYGYDGYYGGRKAPLLFRAVRYADGNKVNEVNKESTHFIITHTGQTEAHDLKGRLVEQNRIEGLDANRITLPMSFNVLNNGNIVQDCHTGLMWDNEHHDILLSFKDAFEFVKDLNDRHYGGYCDWRLPSREELRSIVSYSGHIPAIEEGAFSNVKAELYWTAESHKLDHHLAWGVYFGYGCCIGYPKQTLAYVKAVRGKKAPFSMPSKERFTIHSDGTVTDRVTHLMWMQEETPLLSLKDALIYCKDLKLGGYEDWVLPNMKELGTLINLTEGEEWYFKEIFPDTNTKPQGFYMSSTTFDSTFGWGCTFQFGFDGYYADRMNGKYPFRPVRMVDR